MKSHLFPKVFITSILFIVVLNSQAVTFISQDNGDGTFDITYQGYLPIALALDITLPDGLTTNAGLISVNTYYNFFPDWAIDHYPSVLGEGHPLADMYGPGSLDGNVSNFAVSMAGFAPYLAEDFPAGDLNYDGVVGLDDLLLQNNDWLSVGPLVTDLNADMVVNIMDVGMMNGQQYLDTSVSGVLMTIETIGYNPTAEYDPLVIELDSLRGGVYVPEPATFSLLALGSLAFIRRKK